MSTSTIERKSPSKTRTARKSATSETLAVYLPGDIEALRVEALKAGTTGTNLARLLIRDGLAKLASGESRVTQTTPCLNTPS